MADTVVKDLTTKELTINTDGSTDFFNVYRSNSTNVILKMRCSGSNQGAIYIYDGSGTLKYYVDGTLGLCVIGDSSAGTGAQLTVTSTTKGLLPPRLTTAQANTLSGAGCTAGMVIYNTTLSKLEVWRAGAWETITSTAR